MRSSKFAFWLVLLWLQYRIWFAAGGLFSIVLLSHETAALAAANGALISQNAHLLADINTWRSGLGRIEAEARQTLGLLHSDEVFYRLP